ncbi:MAG: AIR synthase-related protein [Syntrophales bacterium]|nr:AIR synthase-related protein [Syntrophales bacterium]MDD5641163.1 AIR synthase-related protein [Syntrophales bacterium]
MAVRLEIGWRPELADAEGEAVRRQAREYFGLEIERVRVLKLLMLDLDLAEPELEAVRTQVFTHPITQVSSFRPLARDFDGAIWVGYRPGVRDTAGAVALEAIAAFLGRPLPLGAAVYTSNLFLFNGRRLTQKKLTRIARELLANDLIQEFRVYSQEQWDPAEGVGLILPRVELAHEPAVSVFNLDSIDTLRELSRQRHLALREADLPIIRDYFSRPEVLARRAQVGLGPPTDVELEYLAQARSDHCNHNTFRGRFHYRDLAGGEAQILDNPFKNCIEAPTREIARHKPWVVSVLWDNAGVGQFDEEFSYVIKGETHNSPSNLEAYGGSLTGIVGVYRDPLGTGKGARLIGGIYSFCVGPRDYAGPLKPRLHPRRLLDGVIAGVKDGGNKSGVPTLTGDLYFDDSYLGKCLVFVGALGLLPREIKGEPGAAKKASPGDLVITCGGRVGRDGIHGVTASSEVASAGTPAGHVQIGDPYTQKKMHDFLLEARDLGLTTFITDCGGGGLSSAVGESARVAGGVEVWLDKIPLKYAGLDPWEIWISESQERMVVAVKPENEAQFQALAGKHAVEATTIGRYTDSGVLQVSHQGRTCAAIDLSFLEEDFPPWQFAAEWLPPSSRLSEPVLGDPEDHQAALLKMLERPNICAREWITRQYDHEVQGASVLKPLVGQNLPVAGDAVVIRPRLDGDRGLALSLALNPACSAIDTYHMVAVTIDEAVRRLLAVGAPLDHIGGVDNFCWPSVEYHPEANPDGKYKAAQLVRACWALRDLCRAFEIPLLSGKDSMYVDGLLPGAFGEMHRVSGLPTLFFTAVSVLPDLRRALTLDWKTPGDLVYLLGETRAELGGSEFYEMLGYVGLSVPQVRVPEFLPYYRLLAQAIQEELLASCHGLYRGGLAVHLALSSLAAGLGLEVDLSRVAPESPAFATLYSESAGRFLISVAPEHQARVEKHFQGQPLYLLGQVRKDHSWKIIRDRRTLMKTSLDKLQAAWQQRFGNLI